MPDRAWEYDEAPRWYSDCSYVHFSTFILHMIDAMLVVISGFVCLSHHSEVLETPSVFSQNKNDTEASGGLPRSIIKRVLRTFILNRDREVVPM
jgi:hypothetical protein